MVTVLVFVEVGEIYLNTGGAMSSLSII